MCIFLHIKAAQISISKRSGKNEQLGISTRDLNRKVDGSKWTQFSKKNQFMILFLIHFLFSDTVSSACGK